jgi:hypothetical protein
VRRPFVGVIVLLLLVRSDLARAQTAMLHPDQLPSSSPSCEQLRRTSPLVYIENEAGQELFFFLRPRNGTQTRFILSNTYCSTYTNTSQIDIYTTVNGINYERAYRLEAGKCYRLVVRNDVFDVVEINCVGG